ncbi:MAG: hypothetical protein V3U24_03715 [Candidatus Neomarinimicrobiota bacterium]
MGIGKGDFQSVSPLAVVEEENILSNVYGLHQNYPNPLNPVTTLKYDLPERADVTLTIYDILGRQVRSLVQGVQEPGKSQSFGMVFTNYKDRPKHWKRTTKGFGFMWRYMDECTLSDCKKDHNILKERFCLRLKTERMRFIRKWNDI